MTFEQTYSQVLGVCARLCALGLARCTGIDEDGQPTYEVTDLGRAMIARSSQ